MSIALTSLWIAVAALPTCEPAFEDQPALETARVGECAARGRPPCSLAPELEASAGDAEPIGAIP